MNFCQAIKEKIIIFDGAMGTELLSTGLAEGELPESWNITHPDKIRAIHRTYLEAGAKVITANTFGANRRKIAAAGKDFSPAELVREGICRAKEAAADFEGAYVALDIGPTGALLGREEGISFEEAIDVFAEVVREGEAVGADLILIETMSDLRELKAALVAARENSSLPVVATVVFDETGHMLCGADAATAVALAEGMGCAALGANCSLGPRQMLSVARELVKYASIPVVLQPNAGLPRLENGKTVYDVTPEQFASLCRETVSLGAHGIGGCCGTTPQYIRLLCEAVKNIAPLPTEDKGLTLVSSWGKCYEIGSRPLIVGERINPTGKSKIKAALREKDYAAIVAEGLSEVDEGAHILDVNAGLPDIDEREALRCLVTSLQAVTAAPLQLDTADPAAMEASLRAYVGIPLINSVNAKKEALDSILPLVAKYGGVLVGLTLDESGIPDTVEGRLALADIIYGEAEKHKIPAKNIVIDPLTLSVSTDPRAARLTLSAVGRLSEQGRHTLLGVSNVSFGLPERETLNAAFYSLALAEGLSLGIINPHSAAMRSAYRTHLALWGLDESFEEYIAHADEAVSLSSAAPAAQNKEESGGELFSAIKRGLSAAAEAVCERLCREGDALALIEGQIIPALDAVGAEFESGKLFLPQLLSSADAATAAFGVIKSHLPASCVAKDKIIVATVKGDIHDIGKNIVRTMLENYGYEVIDLGKNVSCETILESTIKNNVRLVGLSALMTTTLPAMAETVAALHAACPDCRVMVGGAVLTPEYASKIDADFYAADAAASVRIAAEVLG